MPTQAVITEQIFRLYNGGDPSNNVGIRQEDIALLVREAYGTFAKASYFENGSEDGERYIDGQFIKSYSNVPVLDDIDRSEKYSELPDTIIDLPNGMGVWQISRMKDQFNTFKRLGNGGNSLFSGLGAERMRIESYYVENNRVYYQNVPSELSKVLMKLIPAAPEEEDNIPDDLADRIVSYVLEKLNPARVPEDKVSDNNKQR